MQYYFVSMNIVSNWGSALFCLHRKYLVWNLVSRNLKVKYRYSFFGFLWTLLVPLSQALVYYAVFNVILKVQIPHYLVFILAGILPWAFFSQSILEGMDSVVGNASIVTKVPVPLQVFSLTGSLTNFSNLILATPVLVGTLVWSGLEIKAPILWLPFYWGCLFTIVFGFSTALSLLYVFFRDLKHIFGIIIQLWFYATPVLYDEAMIPVRYQWILSANPVGQIFVGLHAICIHGTYPTMIQIVQPLIWAAVAILFASLALKFLVKNSVEML